MYKTVFNDPELVKRLIKEFEKDEKNGIKRTLIDSKLRHSCNPCPLVHPIYYWIDWGCKGSPESLGVHCKKCNNFNEYAEGNQKDGNYLCYECRS